VRLHASDKLLLGAFLALALGSVGLKAAAGASPDGLTDVRSGQLENQLQAVLRSQNFSTAIQRKPLRTPIVLARRGECRISVRDARGGESFSDVFASDTRSVGKVRYLYAGRTFTSVPGVAVRLGRVGAELRNRFGLSSDAPVPVALATSPECGRNNFRLDEIRIPT
jgi:hypothetical protein